MKSDVLTRNIKEGLSSSSSSIADSNALIKAFILKGHFGDVPWCIRGLPKIFNNDGEAHKIIRINTVYKYLIG